MMVEYVYYDTWFLWNPTAILVWTIVSLIFYFILETHKDEFKFVRVRDSRLLGLIPSVFSVFYLGVFCLITIGLYWMVVLWFEKNRNI